jgi:phospholipase/lecithinase/hemolysin
VVLSGGLFGNLVVFGDSLSDVGNLGLTDNNVETPSPPYYNGHFSNGPLWVDTLASYLGAPPLQPSYVGGMDYAWGGAPLALSFGGYPPSIPEQIGQYLNNLAAAHATIAANDVFAAWAGTNDYLSTFLGANGPINPIDPAASASALAGALQTLVTAGARTVVVANLPLLGNMPYMRATDAFYQEGGALTASANAWSMTYNSNLAADLTALSGAKVVLVDVAGLEDQVSQNPAQYGFTNTTGAVGPFNAPNGGLITSITVPDPQDYFYFDGVHPTTKAQQLIGSTAAQDLFATLTVPAPAVTSVTVNGRTAPVLSASESGNTVTITTDGPHGFTAGPSAVIAGVGGGYDGTYIIASVPNTNTFTYILSTPNLATVTDRGTATVAGSSTGLLSGAQRSMVDSIVYVFNQHVTLAAGAFSIAVHAGQTGTVPTLSWASPDGGTTWIVTFSGSGVIANSIANGVYDLTLNAAAVSAVSGGGTLAASRLDTFYRLYGDTLGTGHQRVNLTDYNTFAGAYATRSTDAGFLAYLDENDDGRINLTDYSAFAGDYGTRYTGFTPTV